MVSGEPVDGGLLINHTVNPAIGFREVIIAEDCEEGRCGLRHRRLTIRKCPRTVNTPPIDYSDYSIGVLLVEVVIPLAENLKS